MPYPSVIPGRAFRAPQPYSSRLLFDWVAADLSLTARSGQVGTFSASGSMRSLILDVNGRPFNAPPGMPRFGTFSGLTGLLFEPAKTQLIENADCEADIVGWNANNGTETLLRDNTIAFGGQWSCKVTTTNAATSGVFWTTRAGPRMAATAGTGYTISTWVWGSFAAVGKTMRLFMSWWNNTPALISTSSATPVTIVAGWQRVTFTAVAPAGTVTVAPGFATDVAQGVFSVWMDDPQLEAVQASTSPFYATAATPTLTGNFTTVDDALTFPFLNVLQPLWAYIKYVDLGVGTGAGGGASGVFQLGNAFQNGWVVIDGGGGNIQLYYEPPGGSTNSTIAYTYTFGNIVEAVIQILNDGSVRGAISINGGVDTLGANGGVPSGGVIPFGNPGTQFNPAVLRFARPTSQFQPFAMVRAKVGAGLLPGVGSTGAGLKLALARAA